MRDKICNHFNNKQIGKCLKNIRMMYIINKWIIICQWDCFDCDIWLFLFFISFLSKPFEFIETRNNKKKQIKIISQTKKSTSTTWIQRCAPETKGLKWMRKHNVECAKESIEIDLFDATLYLIDAQFIFRLHWMKCGHFLCVYQQYNKKYKIHGMSVIDWRSRNHQKIT